PCRHFYAACWKVERSSSYAEKTAKLEDKKRAKLPPEKLLRWAYRSTRRAVDLWPAWSEVNARPLKPIEL
ncbi:MAG: hypothetical protein ABW034_19675, partial [Steroidobacteraceae bacterium]